MVHVGSERADAPHSKMIRDICGAAAGIGAVDWVAGATGVCERRNFPRIGRATTRRALRRLTQAYCDDFVQAVTCFCCGQIRTTLAGQPCIDYSAGVVSSRGNVDIEYVGKAWLQQVNDTRPGTLECNCGYDTWRNRYTAGGSSAPEDGDCQYLPFPYPSSSGAEKPWQDAAYELSEWCFDVNHAILKSI